MEDNATKIGGLSPLTVAIIAIISAATVLLIYHFIVVRLCSPTLQDNTTRSPPRRPFPDHPITTDADDVEMSLETSIAELLPSYKYTKDIGLVSKTQDGTCAVCLSEFVEGEEVRILPECLHPFHVPCIDMWLYSHSSCPLCRADTPNRISVARGSDARLVPDAR